MCFGKNDFIEKVTGGYTLNWLVPNAQKNIMEPVHMVLSGGAKTDDDFPHEGEEFGYVIKGEISIKLGKRSVKVKKGESFYFTPKTVHCIENKKDTVAEFIWVSSPPSF